MYFTLLDTVCVGVEKLFASNATIKDWSTTAPIIGSNVAKSVVDISNVSPTA